MIIRERRAYLQGLPKRGLGETRADKERIKTTIRA